jgi:hypothetical protein
VFGRRIWASLGLGLTACAIPLGLETEMPDLPFSVRGVEAEVRASSETRALEGLRSVEAVSLRIRSAMGADLSSPPTLALLEDERRLGGVNLGGHTLRGVGIFIHASRPDEQPWKERWVIAHELVHWYSGEEWEALPSAIEEGLALMLSADFAPRPAFFKALEYERALQAEAELGLADQELSRLLTLTVEKWAAAGKKQREMILRNGLGLLVVRRVGVQELRRLCLEVETSSSPESFVRRIIQDARLAGGGWEPTSGELLGRPLMRMVYLDREGRTIGEAVAPESGAIRTLPPGAVRYRTELNVPGE